MDENGILLGIDEVRTRLVQDLPLLVNPDANWNRRVSSVASHYLRRYMAKNLYILYTPLSSEYGYETKEAAHKVSYVYLLPPNHPVKPPFMVEKYRSYLSKSATLYTIYNEQQFWQQPR
jgi:hypothetical protein